MELARNRNKYSGGAEAIFGHKGENLANFWENYRADIELLAQHLIIREITTGDLNTSRQEGYRQALGDMMAMWSNIHASVEESKTGFRL